MYLSIRDETIRTAGYTNLKEALKDLEIDSVEIAYKRKDEVIDLEGRTLDMKNENEREIFKKQFAENRIKISAFLMSNNFRNKDIEEELSWAIRCIKFAQELGINIVRIDVLMEGERNISTEEAKNQAVKCLRYILENTENIELAIENHGFHANNPEFIFGVLKEVNSPRLGVTMDTGNFYWSGKPLQEVYKILENLAPYTKHTHLKNISYPEDVREKIRPVGWEYGKYVCPIFAGDIDHQRIINFLKKAGYSGDLTIEDESLGKFLLKEERIEILKKDVSYLKNILSLTNTLKII